MEYERRTCRRAFLRGAMLLLGGSALAACGATPTPAVIEKEVTRVVEGTPQVVKETVVVTETVKETVVVEKQVTVEVLAKGFLLPANSLI